MSRTPIAFLSYVNLDDQHEQGRLTQLRERLSGEVRMQTGAPFDIFQDRKDIAWGQQWQERLDTSLDAVTFLLPIITPSFFKSTACRAELEHFLKREEELGRGDLILSVYYANCPVLEDKEKRQHDPLAQIIAARQRADWRPLRFKPFDSEQVGETLAKMAQQIVAALERSQRESSRPVVVRPADVVKEAPASPQLGGKEQSGAQSKNDKPQPRAAVRIVTVITLCVLIGGALFAAQYYPEEGTLPAQGEIQPKPVAPTELSTVVVDQLQHGNYTTITDALKAVKAGSKILVRPGVYHEGIVIDKPVEIIGDGEQSKIVIEATGKPAVLFKADNGKVANLTLRQAGDSEWYAVAISQGRLDLEDCDISSQGWACVAIHDGADPRLRRNRIHDGKGHGVLVSKNGKGTLEDNEISANTWVGVMIREGGNPTLHRNRIHDGKSAGVLLSENGQGTLEGNEIFANTLSGVGITEGGKPTLRGNHISNNSDVGIWVLSGGGGIFEGNDLRGNTKGAWLIASDCEARVQRSGNKE